MSTRRLVPQATLVVARPRPDIAVQPRPDAAAQPRAAAIAVQLRPCKRGDRRAPRSGGLRRLGVLDPLEQVALVARERRDLLLATYAHRLGREELEDCYSQSTLELLARARRPRVEGTCGQFACREHIANALEQRLCSRIQDRHRALGGRSPIEAAIARALPLVVCGERAGDRVRTVIDERADVERIALVREELARIARFSRELTRNQRLLLASQLSGQAPREFCAEQGWGVEKYRKVGQRARARLSRLLAADSAVPVGRPGRISTQGPAYDINSPTA